MQRVVLDMSRSIFAKNSPKYLELKETIEELKSLLHCDEEILQEEDLSNLPTMIPRSL